jgi:ATP-dependent Clp protease ATP-binding subunit ClpA
MTMPGTAAGVVLDPTLQSPHARHLEAALRARIVGQDDAVHAIVSAYQVFLTGMNLPNHPAGTLLFLGPTGSGKTRIVEATAEALFGDARALLHIDCGEFQHSHEIAKLIGSPPGYLGHRETHPVLTQEALNQWRREDLKLSLVLFDEIEKASDTLWQLLLGILDRATLTLGDNRRVDFSHVLIFLTSNLGAAEMAKSLGGGIGFGQNAIARRAAVAGAAAKGAAGAGTMGVAAMGVGTIDPRLEQKLKTMAIEAARRKFSPEFLNRIDKTVAFRPLAAADLDRVLAIELDRVCARLVQASSRNRFAFHLTAAARQFLLAEGLDLRYGARHLRRSIERHLVAPLAHLMASGQIGPGDSITVDLSEHGPQFLFLKDKPSVRMPERRPEPVSGWIGKAGHAPAARSGEPRHPKDHSNSLSRGVGPLRFSNG